MHFGATLRLLRVDAGLTLRELADRVGVSNAYLSRVENGHDAPPSPDRLTAIARVFGLSPTVLIELADRITPIAADYFDTVPAARELMLDVVRRRLSAVDIARIRAYVAREFPVAQSTPVVRDLERMLDPERVIVSLACSDLEDAVDVAAIRLAGEGGAGSAAAIAGAVMARERSASTALGGGLAVPHAIVRDAEPRAVVVTLRRPLALETPDGLPLKLLIVHVHPGRPEHTRVLAELARLAEPSFVDAVATKRAGAQVVRDLRAFFER